MSGRANSLSGNSSNFAAELAFALSLADRADAISLSRYRALDLQITTKPDNTPVTDADRAVEQAIRDAISATYPADTVVGEEFGGSKLTSDDPNRYWVIDPIDGTKNFLRGVPTWATLIALVVGGQVVIAGAAGDGRGARAGVAEDGVVASAAVDDVRRGAARGVGHDAVAVVAAQEGVSARAARGLCSR